MIPIGYGFVQKKMLSQHTCTADTSWIITLMSFVQVIVVCSSPKAKTLSKPEPVQTGIKVCPWGIPVWTGFTVIYKCVVYVSLTTMLQVRGLTLPLPFNVLAMGDHRHTYYRPYWLMWKRRRRSRFLFNLARRSRNIIDYEQLNEPSSHLTVPGQRSAGRLSMLRSVHT